MTITCLDSGFSLPGRCLGLLANIGRQHAMKAHGVLNLLLEAQERMV